MPSAVFYALINSILRPYKITPIESLPLKNTATLFVYSEKSCKFATNKLTPLPIEQRAQGKPFIIWTPPILGSVSLYIVEIVDQY